jgi:hypothetical protein
MTSPSSLSHAVLFEGQRWGREGRKIREKLKKKI